MNPFERKHGSDGLKVQVNDTIYTGNEVVAYFEEILGALGSQERSLLNKAQFINLAKILIRKNENRKAAGVIHQAVSRYPRDNSILKLKVDVFLNLKDYQSAIQSVDESIAGGSGDISLLTLKGKVLSRAGDEEGEVRLYKEILQIPRYDFEYTRGKLVAMRRLADIYFKRERFSEAVEIVEKILRKSPDESTWAMYFTMLMRQGKSDASKTAKDAFARYRRALVYFDKGTEYEMQNKFSLAVSNYRRGLEIYPDEPSVQMKVGSILMYRKNWHSKAEDFIRKAVELDPDNATYRSSLVICLANQGKFNDAYDEAKVAERMDPLSNIFMMRQIAGRIKRGDEFISLIKEAINRDTMRAQPALRYELGLFYDSRGDQEMADKWFGEALQVLMEHVKNFPDDWELYMEMGNCCKRLRLFKEAENAYQAAEQVSGASLKDVYESLVDLYQRSNQPDKTAIYLKKLIKQEPNKIVNYLDLGISYLSRLTKSLRRKSDNI